MHILKYLRSTILFCKDIRIIIKFKFVMTVKVSDCRVEYTKSDKDGIEKVTSPR